MAGAVEYWLDVHNNSRAHINTYVPHVYNSCIFHQQWYEYCKVMRRSFFSGGFRIQHVDYLTQILLESLLSRDFITAARCVTALCGTVHKVPELIWRTGCDVLMSLNGNHARRIQFFKYVFMLCYPQQEEILLNFVMYLVQHHKSITEAYELLSSKSTLKSLSNSRLLQGYMGLFEYILWKSKAVKQRRSSVEDGVEETEIPSSGKDNIMYHANKALKFFENLVESEGVWDIFILRQVELLMVIQRADIAQKVLERYREKNPENPNAHRYLYYFHKKQKASKSTLLQILESLFAVDPTSELVMEYYNLLTDNSDKEENNNNIFILLEILFNKLDHYSSKNSLKEWKALAKTLKLHYHDNVPNKEIMSKVNEYWDERSDWWPGYHFDVSMVTTCLSDHDYDVVKEKAKVAKFLISKDSEFVRRVKKLKRRKQKTSSNETDVESSSCCTENDSPRKLKRHLRNIDPSSPTKRKKDRS